jgi:hypothetical protein
MRKIALSFAVATMAASLLRAMPAQAQTINGFSTSARAAALFCFLRQPSRPNAPRPVAKSGRGLKRVMRKSQWGACFRRCHEAGTGR